MTARAEMLERIRVALSAPTTSGPRPGDGETAGSSPRATGRMANWPGPRCSTCSPNG